MSAPTYAEFLANVTQRELGMLIASLLRQPVQHFEPVAIAQMTADQDGMVAKGYVVEATIRRELQGTTWITVFEVVPESTVGSWISTMLMERIAIDRIPR